MDTSLSQLSQKDLIRYYQKLCTHIESLDSNYKVFVSGTFDPVLIEQQIKELYQRFPKTDQRPPLFGIPVGVKDVFHCLGMVTRCGSKLPHRLFNGQEAPSVTRLKNAGAIIVGKTATTEFAYFAPTQTCNPLNMGHTPGGSSSGSAAGISANFFEYSLGTQTIGSIIRPAAYCGVVGFKPSKGRVPAEGVIPFSWTMDQVGVFAKSVEAVAKVAPALLDTWHPESIQKPKRLGVPIGPYLQQADDYIQNQFTQTLKILKRANIDVIEMPCLESIEKVNRNHNDLIAAEIGRYHRSWFEENKALYHPKTRQIIQKGLEISEDKLDGLKSYCLEFRTSLDHAMATNRIDALICPSTTSEAPYGLESTGSPLMNLPWTCAGLPSITLPYGTGPNGLPLGIQLVGRFMNDESLLCASKCLENVFSTTL